MADRLTEAQTGQEAVREHLGYVRKRLSLMQYPTFQSAGWPIGSGMVESANKLVVEARRVGNRDAMGAQKRESAAGLAQQRLQ
jgi:hypothetical protein